MTKIMGKLWLSLILPGLLSSHLLAAEAETQEPFTLNKAAKIKAAFRQTKTQLTLTNKEIQEILWQGSFLFFNVAPVKSLIKDLLARYQIEKAVLAAAIEKNLLTLTLKRSVSIPDFTNQPILADQVVAIKDFTAPTPDSLIFSVTGFRYGNVAVTEFHWTNDAAHLVLADGSTQTFNHEKAIEYYQKNRQDFDSMSEENKLNNKTSNQIVESLFSFLFRFKTSDPDNRIHILLKDGQIYDQEIKGWLGKITDKNPAISQFTKSIGQFYLVPKYLVIDSYEETVIDVDAAKFQVEQRVILQSFEKGTINIQGISVNNKRRPKWYPITNMTSIPARPEFPEGGIRILVRAGSMNIGNNYDFKSGRIVVYGDDGETDE